MSSSLASLFAVTRTKFLVAVSLIITYVVLFRPLPLALELADTSSHSWWFASILPHYQPAIKTGFKARLGEAVQKIPSIKVDWPTHGHNPRDAYNASKLALLIEPRPLTHLVPHILHMMAVVPPDWRFLFIGTEESVAQVGRAYSTQYQQVIGKLDLMVLPEPWKIDTRELVWRTLTDPRFYDEFLPGVEWLLKYESDSIMCANSEKSLNDWLDWSWVGAPKYVAPSSRDKEKERGETLTCAEHGTIVSLAPVVSPSAACPSSDRSWNSRPGTTTRIPKTNGLAPASNSCPAPKSPPI